MKSLNERAADLLQGCETVILSSVNQEGYPRPVPLSKIASEGISEIWMATGEHSVKRKISGATRKRVFVSTNKGIALP